MGKIPLKFPGNRSIRCLTIPERPSGRHRPMTKILIFSALLLAPLAAHAECAIKDFAITDFKPSVESGMVNRLSLRGELMNNCATASAAQIRVDIKDESGRVIQTKKAWPAGTSNVTPGQAVKFDLGRLFHYQTGMASYTASIVSVRSW
ncbi:MAG: hypothetical protein ABI178_11945 [Rhodanobacter sp.]